MPLIRHILVYMVLVVTFITSTAIRLHHHRGDGSICMCIELFAGHHDHQGHCHDSHPVDHSNCIFHNVEFEISKSIDSDALHAASSHGPLCLLYAQTPVSPALHNLCSKLRTGGPEPLVSAMPRAAMPLRAPPHTLTKRTAA